MLPGGGDYDIEQRKGEKPGTKQVNSGKTYNPWPDDSEKGDPGMQRPRRDNTARNEPEPLEIMVDSGYLLIPGLCNRT